MSSSPEVSTWGYIWPISAWPEVWPNVYLTLYRIWPKDVNLTWPEVSTCKGYIWPNVNLTLYLIWPNDINLTWPKDSTCSGYIWPNFNLTQSLTKCQAHLKSQPGDTSDQSQPDLKSDQMSTWPYISSDLKMSTWPDLKSQLAMDTSDQMSIWPYISSDQIMSNWPDLRSQLAGYIWPNVSLTWSLTKCQPYPSPHCGHMTKCQPNQKSDQMSAWFKALSRGTYDQMSTWPKASSLMYIWTNVSLIQSLIQGHI